jgi:hypothetical protein
MRGETAARCPTGLATKRGIAELCKFTGKFGVGQTSLKGSAVSVMRCSAFLRVPLRPPRPLRLSLLLLLSFQIKSIHKNPSKQPKILVKPPRSPQFPQLQQSKFVPRQKKFA